MDDPSSARNQDLGTQAARLANLEQRLRKLSLLVQLVLLPVCIGLALVVMLDHSWPDGLLHRSARYSSSGPTAAIFTQADKASLSLQDSEGRLRGILAHAEDGDWESLVFLDADGHMRVDLGLSASGPSLRFFDSQGRMRLTASVLGDEAHVLLLDADGNVEWSARPLPK